MNQQDDDAEYHLYNSIDWLESAQNRLYHQGNPEVKSMVESAIERIKMALKLIKEK